MRFISQRGANPRKFWLLVAAISLLLFLVGVGALRNWYTTSLRPVSSSMTTSYFTVEAGSGVQQIATQLQRAGLIRSSQALVTYVRSNELHNDLQAGTYRLSPSMSVQVIVKKMVDGDVAKNLLTILPAKRLDQIKEAFRKAGYAQAAIDQAFNPSTYAGHPALVSLPVGASLEGYLYPDSFQKEADTPAETIIRQSLDEMQQHLTADVMNGFTAQGLTAFRGITLASIVVKETDNPVYQSTVAQVLLSRLKQDILLQSDPTADYGADLAGKPRSNSFDSPYNTYLHKGLTPGPISNVTGDALKAVAHPATTDYLYFVAGDDDSVHFSHTAEEHQAAIDQFCHKKCRQ
jgi:UPF0755 protein